MSVPTLQQEKSKIALKNGNNNNQQFPVRRIKIYLLHPIGKLLDKNTIEDGGSTAL